MRWPEYRYFHRETEEKARGRKQGLNVSFNALFPAGGPSLPSLSVNL
jgi:hypothetical protein